MEQSMVDNSLQDRVMAICNDLYSKGQKVSVRIVLSMLPDVSSTSTVHKHYKIWKDELEANQKSLLEKMGFSEEFTRVFMSEITRHATEAERRYREIADDAKEQSIIAIEDLERAEDRLYKQTALLEQREKEIKFLQSENLQASKAQDAIVKELRQQIDDLQLNNNELAGSNESLRTEIAKTQLMMEGDKNLVATLKEQNHDLTEDAKRLNVELIAKSTEIARFESSQDAHFQLVEELKLNQTNLQEQTHNLEGDRSALQIERNNLRDHLDRSVQELSDVKDKLASLNEKAVELKATVSQQYRVVDRYEVTQASQDQLIAELKKGQQQSEQTISKLEDDNVRWQQRHEEITQLLDVANRKSADAYSGEGEH